jgi:uncharacterized protein YbaA (DUF1428 family)
MAKYVDGFVLSVEKKNLDRYLKMAQLGAKLWKKHGAIGYFEGQADDIHPKDVVFTFDKMAKSKEDEVTFFSFIVFKSRKHRDQVNAKVMKDPAMGMYANGPMPFNMKRMAYGGFEGKVVSL